MSTETLDHRFLRTAAQGVTVPSHTETDRTVFARQIPNRGGNALVHQHHNHTAEDHIPANDFDELVLKSRKWLVLLYGTLAAMVILFVLMINRG